MWRDWYLHSSIDMCFEHCYMFAKQTFLSEFGFLIYTLLN